jgi:hypothetical protein
LGTLLPGRQQGNAEHNRWKNLPEQKRAYVILLAERSGREQTMPNITSKQDLIAYFAEKSQRSAKDGGTYFETVNEMLMILDETDDVAEIKAVVRNLHREKLKEIQRTESIETRIELRKQLGIYDDCLTQIRTIPVQ